MKNLSKPILTMLAAGVISCALFSQQVQADTIQGDIDFTGKAQFDTTSLDTATRVIAWSGNNPNPTPVVATSSGDFATYASPGDAVTMGSPWIFNPSTPTPGLWTVGGFTFDLASSTIVTQTTTLLYITGVGTITGNGFDPTSGTWAFTSTSFNGKGGPEIRFHFNSNTTAVPDGGSAVALLGIALTGLEVLRRKLRA